MLNAVISTGALWWLTLMSISPDPANTFNGYLQGRADSIPTLAFDSSQPPILGNTIAHGIDTTVSPCDNFYEYANGGWSKSYTFADTTKPNARNWNHFRDLPLRINKQIATFVDSAHRVATTTSNPLIKAVGLFHESCMIVDSLEPVPQLRKPKKDSLKKDSTRAERCISRSKQYLGGALGQHFAELLEADHSVSDMENLLAVLKEAAHERIGRHTLLSQHERENAQERLKRLFLRVGIPEVKIDYSGLQLSGTDYHGNKDAIANFNTMKFVGSIGNDTREKWMMSLFTVNAFYSPFQHAIEIPTAMFNRPFFSIKENDALNFAGVGYIIGHEMFHGLTPNLDLAEDSVVKEQIDSFKAFHSSHGNMDGWHTDGKRTYSEDIADLGGVRTAYDAWQIVRSRQGGDDELVDGFTPEQAFFLGVARVWRAKWIRESAANGDVHAAYFARVNGSVMQMPEFARAFGCKAGDKMFLEPDKMSKLW